MTDKAPPIAVVDHLNAQQQQTVRNMIATADAAAQALAFLDLPAVKAFFFAEGVEAYEQFLAAANNDARLAAQARGVAANALYNNLVKAVARGRRAATELAELSNQGGPK